MSVKRFAAVLAATISFAWISQAHADGCEATVGRFNQAIKADNEALVVDFRKAFGTAPAAYHGDENSAEYCLKIKDVYQARLARLESALSLYRAAKSACGAYQDVSTQVRGLTGASVNVERLVATGRASITKCAAIIAAANGSTSSPTPPASGQSTGSKTPPNQPNPDARQIPSPQAEVRENTATTDSSDPTDIAGFYSRGQRRATKGDYALAADDFTEVLNRDPKHFGALNDRCWVRTLLGELQPARKDCDTAVQIDPTNPDALDSRGLVDLKLGSLEQAISDYSAALRLNPKLASALYGRGVAEQHRGQSANAKRDIDAANAIDPGIAKKFVGYGIE